MTRISSQQLQTLGELDHGHGIDIWMSPEPHATVGELLAHVYLNETRTSWQVEYVRADGRVTAAVPVAA